ncbi:unnamed protein product, partial [Staurois parvus]
MWVSTQEPHDPLLPGGPINCQSAPRWQYYLHLCCWILLLSGHLYTLDVGSITMRH